MNQRRTIADGLDAASRSVRDSLWKLEDSVMSGSKDTETEQRLELSLKGLHIQVMLALDHLNLGETRSDLAKAWGEFVKTGLREFEYFPEPGVAWSAAYDYLEAVIDGIRLIELNPMEGDEAPNAAEIHRFERFLEDTNYTLQKRSIVPTKEGDVQHVMEEYLEFVYGADFCRQFDIPGVVKNFRPDVGILSLQAVVEFKFADNSQELKNAISGLFEDASGYKGSADWKRFYSIIYMTGAYGTRAQLLKSFEQAGLVNWTPILVVGVGQRLSPKRRVGALPPAAPLKAKTPKNKSSETQSIKRG